MTVSRLLLAAALAASAFPAWCLAQDKPNDAVVPAPKTGNWMTRHESFNAKAKQGDIDLLFIGDSITQGWEGVPPRGGREVWAEFYGKRKALNLGISGDRTQNVLWRLDNGNIDGIKPKLAVLMIGTNNSNSNTSEQIAAGVKAIVEKLRAKLPETKVLVLAVFPRGADKDYPQRKVNEGANAIIKGLADDKAVFYLDIGPKFLAEDGTLSTDIMHDRLHLTDKGYRMWAEAIEPAVKKLMGE